MKLTRSTPQKNKAQAMVEFAIALPILLMVMYGLLEAGRLLFTYSSILTATREAARYGSTTGIGANGVARYLDCKGMREAAQQTDFFNVFEDDDITIWFDDGPDENPKGTCPAAGSGNVANVTFTSGNTNRVVVKITGKFTALVPNLVPFVTREIPLQSARTIILSITIASTPTPGGPTATAGPSLTPTITSTPTATNTATKTPTRTSTVTPGPSPTATRTNTPTATPLPNSCDVTYVVNQWNNGFTAEVTIKNNGATAINGYTLAWVFTAGQQVTSGWNATFSQSGSTVNASNPAGNWNGTIAAGNTVSFGFQATHSGSNPTPANFTLNGLPCTGGSPLPTATLTPSLTPSPIPTSVACNQVSHGTIAISNGSNTMSMTINNPLGVALTVQSINVTWNHDGGRSGGGPSGRPLPLTGVSLSSSSWSESSTTSPYTLVNTPPSLVIPTGTSTITFTFQYNYANQDGTERILINLSTPGCEFYPIDSNVISNP